MVWSGYYCKCISSFISLVRLNLLSYIHINLFYTLETECQREGMTGALTCCLLGMRLENRAHLFCALLCYLLVSMQMWFYKTCLFHNTGDYMSASNFLLPFSILGLGLCFPPAHPLPSIFLLAHEPCKFKTLISSFCHHFFCTSSHLSLLIDLSSDYTPIISGWAFWVRCFNHWACCWWAPSAFSPSAARS